MLVFLLMASVAFKLSTLFLKQLIKPVAANITKQVQNKPAFRTSAVVVGQTYHSWRTYLTHYAEGKTERVFVGTMQEDKAVALAASMLSEGLIYGGSAAILLYEYYRQQQSANKTKAGVERRREEKAERARAEREELDARLRNLEERVEDILLSTTRRKRSWWTFASSHENVVATR